MIEGVHESTEVLVVYRAWIIIICQLRLQDLVIVAGIRYPSGELLLLLRKDAVLIAHPRSRPTEALPLNVVSRAYFDAIPS